MQVGRLQRELDRYHDTATGAAQNHVEAAVKSRETIERLQAEVQALRAETGGQLVVVCGMGTV